MLWIAIHLPHLPVELLTRGSSSPEPLAVADGRQLADCDPKAAARGVRPGLTPSAALALCPSLDVRPRDPAEETEALLGLAGWAARFTPNVAIEFHDALLLEVSGSLRLFHGLAAIVRRLREGLAELGYTATLAAAPTPRAAAWLARAGGGRFVEDPAALEGVLAPLPIDLLAREGAVLHGREGAVLHGREGAALHGREREALEGFTAIGVKTLGAAAALPRDGLARRFGQPLVDALDRALGRAPDPRAWFVPPARFHAKLELPAEVTQTEALLFAVRRLLVQLEGFLAARSGGVQRLALRLFHAESRATEIPIGLVAPARDAAHFTVLVRERFANVTLRDPVRALTLAADDIVPVAGETLGLFAGEHGAPGDWPKLVERLRARLGNPQVQGLAAAEDHRPERASRAGEPGAQYALPLPAAPGPRPFWLLPEPRPLDEVNAVPHHDGPLALLAGPERIESGWWDGADAARDYFIAATRTRELVWVYRGRRPAGWFLHGLFA
jgi:protein ImuB